MLKISKLVGVAILGTALCACSGLYQSKNNTPKSNQSTKLCADDAGVFSSCQDMLVKNKTRESNSNTTKNTDLRFNMLNEYTAQMAADLQNDVQGMQVDAPIAVASFVYLDSPLQSSNTLGNQLAEYFINDLQTIGLPVSDQKLMGALEINDKGDFEFAQSNGKLYYDANIGYVLLGTMLRNRGGVVLNTRIVNYKTKVVIASASKFFPNIVVVDLL
ncbi:FlgO family outer membrane protein [uncultured Paraglaciecola sp.]|uniref:FlgO family outer membrane protein n=1 Tax=uncultured Paraglaciecola sp. TaxID=1765024 RepID=UPI0030DD28EB|tara:strand:+ start:18377 stop:19027 length:651 start_codon:yes stop_codon:yes gene_type:complete